MLKKFFLVLAALLAFISYKIYRNVPGFLIMLDTFLCEPPTNPNAPKVLITWCWGMGEQEFLQRLKVTAEKKGIELRVYEERVTSYEKYFRSFLVNRLVKKFQPDFALHFDSAPIASASVPSYLLIYNDFAPFMNPNNPKINLGSFQGFFYCAEDPTPLKQYIEQLGFTFYGLPVYPTCQDQQFTHPTNFSFDSTLFYCGFGWDARRKTDFHKTVILELEKQGYLSVYGKQQAWTYLSTAFKGFLPSDGQTFLQTMHNHGITLIFHSAEHIKNGAPSGRIFEAAAANTLIIADRNPFVEKFFGDHVLYLEETDDPIALYNQINSHVQWAKTHPDEAKKLADASHEIFLNNFTLEQQWDKIIEFHKSLHLEPVSR
jgi:hypothetical protein